MKRRSFLKSLLGITSAIIAPAIAAKAVFTKSKPEITVSGAKVEEYEGMDWKWETVLDDGVNYGRSGKMTEYLENKVINHRFLPSFKEFSAEMNKAMVKAYKL